MSIERKRIVIIVLQYSVVVKGIEKKLTDSGYIASVLSDDLDRIPDHASTTDLFILYLPNDVPDKFDVLEKVSYVCKRKDCNSRPGQRICEAGRKRGRPRSDRSTSALRQSV